MSELTPAEFGPVFAELLQTDRCRALDAGRPEKTKRAALERLAPSTAFAHARLVDRDMAQCCLAGAWLLHDFLDESHAISQNVATTSGSFWHGVMHRREGDFSNAKYWFTRVGSHEVFGELPSRVIELADDPTTKPLADRLISRGRFDPFAFVDVCQSAHRSAGSAEAFCRRVQQAEWELLFAHCYRQAVGA
jgi:hypothetical protein